MLHVSCAEKFLLAYPANTAPDGFFCPACHGPFFPPDMVASPVADQLRATLEGMKDLQKRFVEMETGFDGYLARRNSVIFELDEAYATTK